MTLTEAVWLRSTVTALLLDLNIAVFMSLFLFDTVQIFVVTGCFHAGAVAITAGITPLCRAVDRLHGR